MLKIRTDMLFSALSLFLFPRKNENSLFRLVRLLFFSSKSFCVGPFIWVQTIILLGSNFLYDLGFPLTRRIWYFISFQHTDRNWIQIGEKCPLLSFGNATHRGYKFSEELSNLFFISQQDWIAWNNERGCGYSVF